MSKKAQTSLVVRSSAPETAAAQVVTMAKVLAPYEPWAKVKSLAVDKIGEASAVVVAIRELVDTAEKGRKALTEPLLEEKKAIDNVYKAFKESCAKLDDHVSNLLVVVQAQERARLAREAETQAKKLEKAGATQAASDIREAAESAPVIGGSGLTTFTTVTCKVNDVKKLCKAIADGAFPTDLVEPSMKKLNALVRAGMVPPGCERVETTDVKRTA